MAIHPITKHVVLATIPAWGHGRPMCAFAGRVASEANDILVTFLVPSLIYEKATVELAKYPEHVSQRIRLVSLFDTQTPDIFDMVKTFDESYPAAYRKLVDGEPIQCAISGKTFEAVSTRPGLVVIDFFAINQLDQTRAITGTAVPVLTFAIGGIATLQIFYEQHFSVLAAAEAEMKATGGDWAKITSKWLKHSEGKILNPPGLPPIYDYEMAPQLLPFELPVGPLLLGCNRLVAEADGIIVPSSSMALEPVAIETIAKTFAPNPIYTLGPLLADDFWKPHSRETVSAKDLPFVEFMDRMEARFGEDSVMLISFGTIFWPSKMEYVEEVIEALLEANFPFVFSHASPFASIPERLVKRVEESGIGLLSNWSPQHLLLNHKATGWSLTHGGAGGVTESLASGTPLIVWPFDGDQPLLAKQVKHALKVGFELNEVKTALDSTKPIYDTGAPPKGTREAVGEEFRDVIARCRGKEGATMKQRVQDMKDTWKGLWGEHGDSRKALRNLLTRYLD